jgi:AraC-like DNA-binding protein
MCSTRTFGKHWHDSFGFGLMDHGGQVSASGRGQVQALAGQIITTNPGEVHDGMPLDQQARRWRMVYVTPQVLADTVALSDVELTRPVLDDPLLRQVFGALFRHWIPASSENESRIHEELFTRAIGLLVQRHSCASPLDERFTSLYRVRECLLDQLDSPPTLNALAELAGLSRYQLVRQFSQVHGLPPFAWLQQHRLRHAQALIAQGSALSDAALNSGFSDQSHLTRAFARYLGFTPGSWQRAHRLGVQ